MGVILLVVVLVVIFGAIAAIFGWDRYRGPRARRGAGAAVSPAQPTAEVFLDPATGRRMRVWFNPATGEREYRPE
jgi:hypothetical protein